MVSVDCKLDLVDLNYQTYTIRTIKFLHYDEAASCFVRNRFRRCVRVSVVAIVMASLLTDLQRFETVGRRRAFAGVQRRALVVRVVQVLEHVATLCTLRAVHQDRLLVTVRLTLVLTRGLCEWRRSERKEGSSV